MGSLRKTNKQTTFPDISGKTKRKKTQYMMWEMRKIEKKGNNQGGKKEFHVAFYAKMLNLNEKENGK